MEILKFLKGFETGDIFDLVASQGNSLEVAVLSYGGKAVIGEVVVQQIKLKQTRDSGEVF